MILSRSRLFGLILLSMLPPLFLLTGGSGPGNRGIGERKHLPARGSGLRSSSRLAKAWSHDSAASRPEPDVPAVSDAADSSANAAAVAVDGSRAGGSPLDGLPSDQALEEPLRSYPLPLIYSMEEPEFLRKFPMFSSGVLEDLRSRFEHDIAAGDLSPDEPEYAARWERAEMSLRDRIRVLYGWAAWADYSREMAGQPAGEAGHDSMR